VHYRPLVYATQRPRSKRLVGISGGGPSDRAGVRTRISQKKVRAETKMEKRARGRGTRTGTRTKTKARPKAKCKMMQARVQCAVETIVRRTDRNGSDAEAGAVTEHGYVYRLIFVSGGDSESSSQSLSSRSSVRDRFLPRPRQVISGYSHSLHRLAHCLYNKGRRRQHHNTPLKRIPEKRTHWHVLSWRSPSRGRHWIFRRRQKRHASLARSTGRLRPNRGKVKADSSTLLLSVVDAAGAPVEDDGRDDSDESGLDAAE